MSVFLILACLLTIVVTAYVTWPLLGARRSVPGSLQRRADAGSPIDESLTQTLLDEQARQSLEIHRERLTTLEGAIASGEIDPGEADAQRLELERALADDLAPYVTAANGPVPTLPKAMPSSTRLVALACGVVLPAAAVLLYLQLGSPHLLTEFGLRTKSFATAPDAVQGSPPTPGSPQEMVQRLEQRLLSAPDDGAGWRLLGRSYFVLGRLDEAVGAYTRAEAILGEQTELLIEHAEVESVRDGYRFNPQSLQRLERALELVPDHPKALMLGGLAALQAGNKQLASERIGRLLRQYRPDTQEARNIREIAAQAGLELSGTGAAADAVEPSQTSASTKDTAQPLDAAAAVRVLIDIDPALLAAAGGPEQLRSGKLFVFARAAGAGGSPPLAAQQLPAAKLPVEVLLDDRHAMLPGRSLSSATSVIIGARISIRGNATADSGDMEGFSKAVDPGARPVVNVIIRRRIP